MRIDLDLLHLLLIQNADIGMPLRDLSFALGQRKTDVEVALIHEASLGHIRVNNQRYYTLKKHFPKHVSLRMEEGRIFRLHQLLQQHRQGLLLSELQEKMGVVEAELKEILFAEKTVERIAYVDSESLAYVSVLEFPVEQLVATNRQVNVPPKKLRLRMVGGFVAGLAGLVYYLFFLAL
jgi:hypothetical protein